MAWPSLSSGPWRCFTLTGPWRGWRSVIIPGLTRAQIKEKEKQENKDPNENASLLKKSSPAKLLARVFGIDVSKCTNCGGRMKITSSIFVIPPSETRVFHHPPEWNEGQGIALPCFAGAMTVFFLGLSPIPPPLAPARSRELFVSMW